MKEEALKLAEDLLDRLDAPRAIIRTQASAMIRRLVEELDKHKEMLAKHQDIIADWDKKPLSDDEIVSIWEKANYESQYYEASDNFAIEFARAIEERHGIK